MNALELADALERNNWHLAPVAADLIRELVTEKAYLEMMVANRNEIIDKLDLTPQKQSEPVTYLKRDESTGLYYECDRQYGFPVYTTPQAKPLSDEEIDDCIDNCFGIHAFNLDYEWTLEEVEENSMQLARAIEAKVRGEK
jgi:hypothetical protein